MYLLRTLGGLSLVHASTGAVVGAPRRKPLAVLALVAAGGERGADRDRIASLLWPELDETRARHALSQTLYALRREVGVDLLSAGPRFTIDATRLRTDAGEFEVLTRPGSSVPDLERAVALYDGPYLDGVYFPGCGEFEHWVDLTRAVHSAAYQGALRELARASQNAGDVARAIAWLEAAVRESPLDADAAASLAQSYAAAGRRGQAIASLDAHFAVLHSELDMAPPGALVSLRQELLSAPAITGETPRVAKAPARTPATGYAARRFARSVERIARETRSRRDASADRFRLPERGAGMQGALVASAAIVVAIAGWLLLAGRTDAPASLSLAYREEIARPAGAVPPGRVLLSVTAMPETRALATYVEDVLQKRLASVASVSVSLPMRTRDSTAADRRDPMRFEPREPIWLRLQRTDATLAVEVFVFDWSRHRDSVALGLSLYRRAPVPPCPEAWQKFYAADKDPGGEYDGFESWTSFRIRAPKQAPTRYVDSLVRVAARTLESMRSCDLEAHRGAATSPWCWHASGAVAVVPGAVRARISAGEHVQMSTGTYSRAGRRDRYCTYNSAG